MKDQIMQLERKRMKFTKSSVLTPELNVHKEGHRLKNQPGNIISYGHDSSNFNIKLMSASANLLEW